MLVLCVRVMTSILDKITAQKGALVRYQSSFIDYMTSPPPLEKQNVIVSFSFLVWGTHLAVFRVYSWICAERSLLVELRGPDMVLGIDPWLASCKVRLQHATFPMYSLWPSENGHSYWRAQVMNPSSASCQLRDIK